MRQDSKAEEFNLVEDEVLAIDDLIDEAQSILTWTSPSELTITFQQIILFF